MKRCAWLIFGCSCVVLLFGVCVYPQRKPQSRERKSTTTPTEPVKRPALKETVAEKIVLEGICKSPSPFIWITASNIDIPSSSRSEPTLFRMPDVLLRAELLFHILSAAHLKYLYEAKAFKTEIFPETYRKNDEGLKTLLAKIEDFKKERGSVSSSDRAALYPVIKAYFIDAAITIQEIPRSAMLGNFAEAYKENEKAISDLAKSKPEEGLSSYADKETPLIRVMTAYLIDFATFVRGSYQSTAGGNLAIAFEKNKAKVESITARNWKSDQLNGEERDALQNVSVAASVDVARLLRGAYQSSNKGIFGEAYGKNATQIEKLADGDWEKESSFEFKTAAPALCQALTVYKGLK